MGYKRIDPAAKTRAIKAMRKAVENDELSVYAAAKKLSSRYEISLGSLQKFYAEDRAVRDEAAAEAVAAAPPKSRVPAKRKEIRPDIAEPVAEPVAAAPAGLLSAEFTRTLETLSSEYVARLQEAALDDLIHKMQQLRDTLRK